MCPRILSAAAQSCASKPNADSDKVTKASCKKSTCRKVALLRNTLLLFARVGNEIKLCAGDALELSGALRAGKVVADAEGITLEFIDRGESLAIVGPFGAENGHAL